MDTFIEKVVDFGVNKFKSICDFSENLETLERNVKLLSDKAFDVKTEVENQERSGKKKRKREVESWFDEVIKVEEELRALKEEVTRGKKNGGALEKMNGRVGELLEQSKHFGLLVHDMYESEDCPLPVPEVHEETSKRNLEVIWTWLHDDNIPSIGIWGMGGVGKTTLAKHIHKRLVNDPRYQVRWVTVSHGFSIKVLQDQLANIVDLDLSNEEDEVRRAGELNRAFEKQKNIVIILDDVWDRLCLRKLGDPLGVEGCRLILTTRSHEVCQKMSCQRLLEVKKLNTSDAWELFKMNLGRETLLSPDIEPIATSLAGRCDGLPLGLIIFARSMSGVTDIREWENALKEFPEDMESDVFKILQYSYDRLRDGNMQECFLYCALYPEDHRIDRDELIGSFIMEGLVKGDRRKEEFNKGHTILNKLVKLCLLEEATDDERFERVKMHDLLREMALRITNDKPRRYMVRAGTGSQVPEKQDWAFDLEKVSFYNNKIKAIPEDVAPNCPTLSTLLLSWCSLRSIPGPFFQYMNNLQVLNLSNNFQLMDLPSYISNLASLGALSLRGCSKLTSMPPLGKLKNLRVLDVSDTGINELPQGIGNLVKLEFLNMYGIILAELPKEDILPKLPQLQYLYLPLRMNVRVEDLASFELMEEFGGRFRDLHNFYKFMRNHHNYSGYDITVSESPNCASDREYFGIRRVKKRRVSFEDVTLEADAGEAATSIVLPNSIDILEIIRCHGLMSSSLVDNFLLRPSSRGLACKISQCDEIEWIVNVPSGGNTTPDPHCICFRSLTVNDLRNLIGLCNGKIASHIFSGLTGLNIFCCNRMKKLFPGSILQDLKNLECLYVSGCEKMEEIIGGRSEEESSNAQIISSTTTFLPNLKELHLCDLPKLKSICGGKLMCDSLEEMDFFKCPNVKRLPFYTPTTNQHPFPSLQIIEVDDESWWETLEWEQPHLKTLFQPYIEKY